MPKNPKPPVERSVPKPKSIREIPGYLGKVIGGFFFRLFYIVRLVWETNPWIFLLMVLFCICDGVLPVISAYISRDLINAISDLLAKDATITGLRDLAFASVIGLISWYFIYQFFSKLVGRFSAMLNSLAGELVCNHIRLKIAEKAKTVDISSFDRPEFYEKLENANREAGMRPISILRSTFQVISSLISVISFAVILVGLHPLAPAFVAVMAIPGAVVNYIYRNRQFHYMRFRSKERRQMNYFSSLVVDKDRAKEIRTMGLADTFIGNYKKVFRRYFSGLKRLIVQEGLWQIGLALLSLVAHLALFVYIAFHVVSTESGAIGDYSLYTGALNSISSGVAALISATVSIYEGTLFIDNMITFMKEEQHVVSTEAVPVIPKRHAAHTIEFKNVSFAYPDAEKCVLNNVSFTLKTGERTVLVGLNGAGKTTLIKLLMRLYDPTEGCILLDGIDLRAYDVDALYALYGVVFQDFGKYAVTVRENIAYGDVREKPDEERVVEAAKQGNADAFIRDLPEGYDTPLTRWFEKDGTELSIGQWQKISVARAFYKDSDILILDEPTASLDPIAEKEIYDQFARLGENRISVFVSHRLSSATTADRIIVLNGGCIVEMGTHAELMKNLEGEYRHLFTTQAMHYVSQNGEQIADGSDVYEEE